MSRSTPLLSIVVPCFNESEVVELFHRTLTGCLEKITGLDREILFIDDGSTDGTLEKLNAISLQDPSVRVYSLSRNFGHQVALSAGIDAARGDAVVMMDSDLQHPPSMIPEMVQLWKQGYDIVSTIRLRSRGVSPFKQWSSDLFYWLVNRLSDTPIVRGAADFCLLSRTACDALKSLPERHRFLRGLVSWIGFRRAMLPFEAPERTLGKSKYGMAKMIRLALNATFSFSVVPVRISIQLGILAIVLSLLYVAFVFTSLIIGLPVVPGWTSIICVTTFIGGVQLVFIGVLGEYIARIFEEVKRRPLYFFKQSPGADASAPPGP